MQPVWLSEKITAFEEQRKLIKLAPTVDISMIGIPMSDRGEAILKFITRDDGLSYFKKKGVYPPFVNEKLARRENWIHNRWPLYQRRVMLEGMTHIKVTPDMVKGIG